MEKVKKFFTNEDIYCIALGFSTHFNAMQNLPIKAGFYLIKNKNYFLELGKQIEEIRQEICSKYLDSDGNVLFDKANKELFELSQLEQEVSYYELSLEDFGEANFTIEQLETIEFMIKEE